MTRQALPEPDPAAGVPGPQPVGWRWAPVADRPYTTERRIGAGHVAGVRASSRNCSTYPWRGHNLGNRAWWPGHSVERM